jgi:predicted nucleic acid-binding Zn ribbon protein
MSDVQTMAQEIGATIPTASHWEPKCVVCTAELPKARATSRAAWTCSKECRAVLKAFQKERRAAFKCPTCQHPCTPEQREEFKAWRRHRGDVGVNPPGRKPKRRVQELEEALREAIDLSETLTCGAGVPFDSTFAGQILALKNIANNRHDGEIQNLVDGNAERGKLAASAVSTPGEDDGSE